MTKRPSLSRLQHHNTLTFVKIALFLLEASGLHDYMVIPNSDIVGEPRTVTNRMVWFAMKG
jgi:hypothetical protein